MVDSFCFHQISGFASKSNTKARKQNIDCHHEHHRTTSYIWYIKSNHQNTIQRIYTVLEGVSFLARSTQGTKFLELLEITEKWVRRITLRQELDWLLEKNNPTEKLTLWWKEESYTGNSRACNGCSTVGFTRCSLGPRRLPWFIHVFLCHFWWCCSRAWFSRDTLAVVIPVLIEWTDIEEVAKTRRKRIKHVSEALTCFTIVLFFGGCLSLSCDGCSVGEESGVNIEFLRDNFALFWSHKVNHLHVLHSMKSRRNLKCSPNKSEHLIFTWFLIIDLVKK